MLLVWGSPACKLCKICTGSYPTTTDFSPYQYSSTGIFFCLSGLAGLNQTSREWITHQARGYGEGEVTPDHEEAISQLNFPGSRGQAEERSCRCRGHCFFLGHWQGSYAIFPWGNELPSEILCRCRQDLLKEAEGLENRKERRGERWGSGGMWLAAIPLLAVLCGGTRLLTICCCPLLDKQSFSLTKGGGTGERQSPPLEQAAPHISDVKRGLQTQRALRGLGLPMEQGPAGCGCQLTLLPAALGRWKWRVNECCCWTEGLPASMRRTIPQAIGKRSMLWQSKQEGNNSARHRLLLPSITTAVRHLEILVPPEEIQVSLNGARLLSTTRAVLAAGRIASFAVIIFSGYFSPHPWGHTSISFYAQLSSWLILPGAFPVSAAAGDWAAPNNTAKVD